MSMGEQGEAKKIKTGRSEEDAIAIIDCALGVSKNIHSFYL